MKWVEKIVSLLLIAFSTGIIAAQSITLAAKYRDLFFDSRAGFLNRLMVNDFLPVVAALFVCLGWLCYTFVAHNIFNKKPTLFTLGIIGFVILPIVLVSALSILFNLYIENTTFNIFLQNTAPIPRHYGEWKLSQAGDFLSFYHGGFVLGLVYVFLQRRNKTT